MGFETGGEQPPRLSSVCFTDLKLFAAEIAGKKAAPDANVGVIISADTLLQVYMDKRVVATGDMPLIPDYGLYLTGLRGAVIGGTRDTSTAKILIGDATKARDEILDAEDVDPLNAFVDALKAIRENKEGLGQDVLDHELVDYLGKMKDFADFRTSDFGIPSGPLKLTCSMMAAAFTDSVSIRSNIFNAVDKELT